MASVNIEVEVGRLSEAGTKINRRQKSMRCKGMSASAN
jgi:hypothetical protein